MGVPLGREANPKQHTFHPHGAGTDDEQCRKTVISHCGILRLSEVHEISVHFGSVASGGPLNSRLVSLPRIVEIFLCPLFSNVKDYRIGPLEVFVRSVRRQARGKTSLFLLNPLDECAEMVKGVRVEGLGQIRGGQMKWVECGEREREKERKRK